MRKNILIFLAGMLTLVIIYALADRYFIKPKNRQHQNEDIIRLDSISWEMSLSAEQKASIANSIIDSLLSGQITISDSDRVRIERSIDRLIDSIRISQTGKGKAGEVK